MIRLIVSSAFFLSITSCVSNPAQTNQVLMKRNWVRRVAPESSLQRNSSSQRFSPLLLNTQLIQGSTFGGVKSFSKRTGQVRWEINDRDGVSSHGKISQGKLFYGSYSNKANAYNIQKKSFEWTISLDSSPLAFSEIISNRVYTLTDLGTLYALAADTGAVLWSIKRPAKKTLQIFGAPSPVVYGNQIISAFPDGNVISFDQATGKQKWTLKFDSYQKYEDVDFLELEGSSLLVGSFDEALYSVNPSQGTIKWRVMQGPVSSPMIDGSRVYYSSNKGEIISLDKNSGKIIFKKDVLKGVGNKPAILNNFLIVSDSKGPIYVLDKNLGEIISKYESGSAISSDFSIDKEHEKLYFLSNKGNLFKFGLEREL